MTECEFDNPHVRLMLASSEVEKRCVDGMPLTEFKSVADYYKVQTEDIITHLSVVGSFIIEDGLLKCK
jgi:hypothetical protein